MLLHCSIWTEINHQLDSSTTEILLFSGTEIELLKPSGANQIQTMLDRTSVCVCFSAVLF